MKLNSSDMIFIHPMIKFYKERVFFIHCKFQPAKKKASYFRKIY